MKNVTHKEILKRIFIWTILLSCGMGLCACADTAATENSSLPDDLIEQFLEEQDSLKASPAATEQTESSQQEEQSVIDTDETTKSNISIVDVDFLPEEEIEVLSREDANSAILRFSEQMGISPKDVCYEFFDEQELFEYQMLYKFKGYYKELPVNIFELHVVAIDGKLACISGTGGTLGEYIPNIIFSQEEAENFARQYMSDAGLLDDDLICWTVNSPEIYCIQDEEGNYTEILTLIEIGFDYELTEYPLYSVKVNVETGEMYLMDNILE